MSRGFERKKLTIRRVTSGLGADATFAGAGFGGGVLGRSIGPAGAQNISERRSSPGVVFCFRSVLESR